MSSNDILLQRVAGHFKAKYPSIEPEAAVAFMIIAAADGVTSADEVAASLGRAGKNVLNFLSQLAQFNLVSMGGGDGAVVLALTPTGAMFKEELEGIAQT